MLCKEHTLLQVILIPTLPESPYKIMKRQYTMLIGTTFVTILNCFLTIELVNALNNLKFEGNNNVLSIYSFIRHVMFSGLECQSLGVHS